LNQVKPGWSFALLGLIAIPAFWLQDFFWKLSDKMWSFKLSLIWLFLSAGSLMIMAFFAGEKQIFIILWLAFINSVGYAICMSLAVANFLESYNTAYADRKWLSQIDANASAAPMKILQNLANVFGLFFGWLIISFIWFAGFFFTFWFLIWWFLIWSIVMKKNIIEW
jgi:ABC-type nickel/cobalt efflux system permease component RcnA